MNDQMARFFEEIGVKYEHDEDDNNWFTAIKRLRTKTNVYLFKSLIDARDFLNGGTLPSDPCGTIKVMTAEEYRVYKMSINPPDWRPCEVGDCLMDSTGGPWRDLCDDCKADPNFGK